MPIEAWLTLGGVVVTVFGMVAAALWKFWEVIGGTFERKDVSRLITENFKSQLERIEENTKSTHEYVASKMPEAMEEACLRGVNAGFSLAQQALQMIHVREPR